MAALVEEHGSGLAGAVCSVLGARADVTEVLQEAFAKAVEALSGGSVPRDPVGWLYVVVLNTARDHRRRSLRRKDSVSLEEVSSMEFPTLRDGPATDLERSETLAAARAAIGALEEREKEVFLLRTAAGLSFDAVARSLSIPVGTAKTRMRSALRRLRSALAAHAPERRQP